MPLQWRIIPDFLQPIFHLHPTAATVPYFHLRSLELGIGALYKSIQTRRNIKGNWWGFQGHALHRSQGFLAQFLCSPSNIATGNPLGATRALNVHFPVVVAPILLLIILVLWWLFFMAASNPSLPPKIAIFQALLPAFGKHREHRSPARPARSVLGVEQITNSRDGLSSVCEW